jgi:ribosomal-protein-alanine N-acetyltransferase
MPSGAGFAIERIAERDVPAVAAIERESFTARAAVGHDESILRLREELARPWSRIWVARSLDSHEVLAFILVWKVADEVHVLNLATRPAARRRGLASALMNEVLHDATESDGRLILLEVRRSNEAARALYRQLGFVESGVRSRYYDDGEDAVEMQKTLPSPAKDDSSGKAEVRRA